MSVEVVGENEMRRAFGSWVDSHEKDDNFSASLEFLVELQEMIDEGDAIRIGFSVIDAAVDAETIKNITETLDVVDHTPLQRQVGAIIVGDTTRIDAGTKIKDSPFINESTLRSGSSSSIDNQVCGNTIIDCSKLLGVCVDRSVITDSVLAHCNVINSMISESDVTTTNFIGANIRDVNGSAGLGRSLSGVMHSVNLANNGNQVFAVPKPND